MNLAKWIKGLFVFSALVLLASFSAACNPPPSTPISSDAYPEVDPLFLKFYEYLGGVDVLGEPISGLRREGNVEFQFLENGKLVYDSSAPASQHFQLAPLAYDLNIGEPLIPDPSQPDAMYVDGHVIFPEFVPLYENIGARFVGKPLAEARYNPARNCYEQFFENIGFCRKASDESAGVHLLPYGVWSCGQDCRDAGIDSIGYEQPGQAFQAFVDQVGLDFTGYALTGVYSRKDGSLEQVFEQVVLVTDQTIELGARPLALSKALNIPSDDPRPYSGNPEMYFYSQDGLVGYEVPSVFWDYLTEHGSLQLSGSPITHLEPLARGSRQCFENLCLVYDEALPKTARVRPQGLGYAYHSFYGLPVSTPTPMKVVPTNQISLEVVKAWEILSPGEQQAFSVWVFKDRQPVVGVEPFLVQSLPDGSTQRFAFPPTNDAGQTSLILPPAALPDGTVVIYHACVLPSDGQSSCRQGQYTIGSAP